MTIAETKAEAERQIRAEASELRILRSREIDLGGLPALASGPLPRHWVVVVEHADPAVESTLPQHDDPEEHCERETRKLYLTMAVDPELLTSGVVEKFPCPKCREEIRLELPPQRETRYPQNAQCPNCMCHLKRNRAQLQWAVVAHPPTPYPECAFCPAPADSREHVVPAWVSRRLGVKEELSVDGAFIIGGRGRSQPISFASYRARVMCGECNTHFKHLEDAVIPLLVPMAQGRMLSLDSASQELLALWANKTALALLAAEAETREDLPDGHGEAVRSGAVADNTWIGFFAWHGGPVVGTAVGIARDSARVPEHAVYAVTLTFAGFGMQVVGFADPPPGAEVGGAPSGVVQVWPPVRRYLHWPPPTVDNRILPTLIGFVPLRAKR